MRVVIDVIRYVLTPVAPWQWRQAASRLSNGIGWEPPMMMIAALGIIIPLNVGVGLFAGNDFAATFNLLTTTTWFIVASIATTIVAARCIRNILRYGVFGFTRANWWFECGRLTVISGLFASILCPVALFFPQLNRAVPALVVTTVASAALFAFTATVGYTCAFISGTRIHSKAFQCVHYFYCMLVPLVLLITSAMCWPQPVVWPNGFVVILAGVLSTILLACGMLTITTHYSDWEQNKRDAGE